LGKSKRFERGRFRRKHGSSGWRLLGQGGAIGWNPASNSEAGGHDLEGEGTGGTTPLKRNTSVFRRSRLLSNRARGNQRSLESFICSGEAKQDIQPWRSASRSELGGTVVSLSLDNWIGEQPTCSHGDTQTAATRSNSFY